MTSTYCTTHNFFLSPPCFTISYLKSFTATLCKKKKKKTFLGYVSRNAFLETLYSKKGASNIKPNSWLDIKLVSQPFHPLTQKPQRFVHPFTSSFFRKKKTPPQPLHPSQPQPKKKHSNHSPRPPRALKIPRNPPRPRNLARLGIRLPSAAVLTVAHGGARAVGAAGVGVGGVDGAGGGAAYCFYLLGLLV